MSGYALRSAGPVKDDATEQAGSRIQKRRHASARGKMPESRATDPPVQPRTPQSTGLLNSLPVKDLEAHLASPKACALCGYEKLFFETPVYRCNGATCKTRLIPRDADFYGNNRYFLCTSCFDAKVPIADAPINHADLEKKKNNEVHEEPWVKCNTCERRVHQICGLFNAQQCSHDEDYDCPCCLKEKRALSPPSPRPLGAADLPRTVLSEWLQNHLTRVLGEKFPEEKAESEVSQAACHSLCGPHTELRYFS
jgi:hypothetical protein